MDGSLLLSTCLGCRRGIGRTKEGPESNHTEPKKGAEGDSTLNPFEAVETVTGRRSCSYGSFSLGLHRFSTDKKEKVDNNLDHTDKGP